MLDDAAVRRLVLSQPIPDRLLRALARAPLPHSPAAVKGAHLARQYGCASLDPDDLPDSLTRTLTLICHGHTNRQIATRSHYAEATVAEHRAALFTIFRARNAAHLAALAVAQGYVDMAVEPG